MTADSDRTASAVGTRAFRGVAWSSASVVVARAVTLVTTAVLAHLLSPRAFGLVALALIFTSILDIFKDLGVGQALVVSAPADLDVQADTAFAFTVLMGIVLGALAVAVSPLAAAFFHEPQLFALLAVLGLNLPLRSLARTHYSLAQRRLDFRARTVAELVEVVARAAIGISLALAGLGAWSLVLGYLGGTLAWTIVLWAVIDWRPSLRPRWSELPALARFGGGVTVVGAIGIGMSYVDNLFVGRVLGSAALGQYSLGFRLSEILVHDLLAAAGAVLFGAFAMLSTSELPRGMVAAYGYGLLLVVPLVVGIVVLADPLVAALFGSRWHAVVPVARILSIGFLGAPFAIVNGTAYMATRRIPLMMKLAVAQGILLVVALALFVRHGIAAVAGCQAAARLLFDALGVCLSVRILGIRVGALWRVAWPPVVAAAGMAAIMVPVERAIASPWPALAIGVLLGGVTYIALVWLLARDELATLVRRARGRSVLWNAT